MSIDEDCIKMLAKVRATKYADWNAFRCGSLIGTMYLASAQQDANLVVQDSVYSDRHIAVVLLSTVSESFTLMVLDKLPVPNSPDVPELSSFYDKLKRVGEPSSLTDVLVSKFSVPLVLIKFFSIESTDMLLVTDSLGFSYVWQFVQQTQTWLMVYNFSVLTSSISDAECVEQKQVVSASYCQRANVLVWLENCSFSSGGKVVCQSAVRYCCLTFGCMNTNKSFSDPAAFQIPPSMSQPITILVLDSIHSFHLHHDGMGCWIVGDNSLVFHYDFIECQMVSTFGIQNVSSGSEIKFKASMFAAATEDEDTKYSNTLYLLTDEGVICSIINCRNHLRVVRQVLPLEFKSQLIARANKLGKAGGSANLINIEDFQVVCEDCVSSSGVVRAKAAYFVIYASGHCYVLKHSYHSLAVGSDDLFSSEFWQQSANGPPAVNYQAMVLFEEQVNFSLYRDISIPTGGRHKRSPFLGGYSILPVDSTNSKLKLTTLLAPDLSNRLLFDSLNVAPDEDSSGYSTVLLLMRSPTSVVQINCQFVTSVKSSILKNHGLLTLPQHKVSPTSVLLFSLCVNVCLAMGYHYQSKAVGA